jgi:hypothetical protein
VNEQLCSLIAAVPRQNLIRMQSESLWSKSSRGRGPGFHSRADVSLRGLAWDLVNVELPTTKIELWSRSPRDIDPPEEYWHHLDNSGYLIERLLYKNSEYAYNDIAQWRYSELPNALGCDDWFTARVTTYGELDQALQTASKGVRGAYIQVVTDKYAAPRLLVKLHESLDTLYRA